MNLALGQTLFFVPYRGVVGGRGTPSEVTVTSIGRRWIGIRGNQRIDRITLEVDGGIYSSPGRCYFSRADWEAEDAADEAWSALRQHLLRSRPAGITVDAIKAVGCLLGLFEG